MPDMKSGQDQSGSAPPETAQAEEALRYGADRTYTAAQNLAIATDGVDLCVAAGAGSGKTGVLVERFVRIVTQSRNGVLLPPRAAAVDQILVITFTEKATREMKRRIVDELSRRGLIEERRQVETAYISTIHGFCSRLLQENPFESGVDPQFTVLDETQARRMLRQSFEEEIASSYVPAASEIAELVAAAQSGPRPSENVLDGVTALAQSVESVLGRLRGAGRTLEAVHDMWRAGAERTAAQSLAPLHALMGPVITEVTACAHMLTQLRESLLGASRIACDALVERAGCLLESAGAAIPEALLTLEALHQTASKMRPRLTPSPTEITLGQILHRIRIACEEASCLFGGSAEREERAILHAHRFWGLLVAVWESYERSKRARGVLDSDDLQALAVRLLEETPHVRERYHRHFRHLLIDEFQDTNPLQMRLVQLLHGRNEGLPAADTEGRTDEPRGNFLFVVGDVQQSIYAFRDAEPALFQAMERRFRAGDAGQHVSLAVNFRSRPEILQAVEVIFRQVWRDQATPFIPLSPGAEFDRKPMPSLELLLTRDLMRRDYVTLEADALAARIRRIVEGEELRLTSKTDPRRGEPVAYRDVAVLMRGLTEVQKYEEAFAKRGVPCFVVGGGRGYYARHEIRDLLNVLIVLDTPLDDVALAAALRSPFVGIDTDTLYRLVQRARPERGGKRQEAPLYPALRAAIEEHIPLPTDGNPEEMQALWAFLEVLEALRAQEDRLPVGHLLERLISATHYDARLLCRPGGRRRLANVRKLLQMANSDPVMGVRDFIRRLREMERISDREGDAPTEEEAADVVRILTMHGAKGLEFPVVVLADLSRGLLMPERALFTCDPHHLALGTRIEGDPSRVYRLLDRQRQEADRGEAARLLYVAMTRAREHLLLCGNLGRNRGFTWSDQIFELLGVNELPAEPEDRTLMGGLIARIAPLAYDLHHLHSGPASLTASARQAAEQARDHLARAIAQGEQF